MKYLRHVHMLVEGEIGHKPNIEDKRRIVVVKSGFGGERMHGVVSVWFALPSQ